MPRGRKPKKTDAAGAKTPRKRAVKAKPKTDEPAVMPLTESQQTAPKAEDILSALDASPAVQESAVAPMPVMPSPEVTPAPEVKTPAAPEAETVSVPEVKPASAQEQPSAEAEKQTAPEAETTSVPEGETLAAPQEQVPLPEPEVPAEQKPAPKAVYSPSLNSAPVRNPATLDDIFSKLDRPAEKKEARKVRVIIPDDKDDKKSIKRFRENLLAYDWSRRDVYRLSVKFFGKRSAAELDAQFQKLLNSLHYLQTPDENNELCLKVLLDEITSTEAIKKSLIRKNTGDMQNGLSQAGWAAGYVEPLAKKYVGDKTAEELEARFKIIMSELPDSGNAEENRLSALQVLLDSSRFDELYGKAFRAKYVRQLSSLLGPDVDGEYIDMLADKFAGKEKPEAVAAKIDALGAELGLGGDARSHMVKVRVLAGDMTREQAQMYLRGVKNEDIIGRLTEKLGMSEEDEAALIRQYADPAGNCWFDEEFPRVYSFLPAGSDSVRANSELAVKVLLGEMTQDLAIAQAVSVKNREDIMALSDRINLSAADTASLLAKFDGHSGQAFRTEMELIIRSMPASPSVEKFGDRVAVKVMLDQLSADLAPQFADILEAFSRYAIPEEDVDRIAAQFLSRKTAQELLLEFEAILEKLPYVDSKEENLGVAINVLLDSTPAALEAAREAALFKKDRIDFQRALNSYGWFSGFAADIIEKYQMNKDVPAIIAEFEDIMKQLPHSARPAENHDIAMKVFLGRMSMAEGMKLAEFRRELAGTPWGKDFVSEITDGYLGSRNVHEVLEFFTLRFNDYQFWKNDVSRHRYILDRFLKELNGLITEEQSRYPAKLLECGMPLAAVRGIADSEAHGKINAEPEQLCERYHAILDEVNNPDKAAAQLVRELTPPQV